MQMLDQGQRGYFHKFDYGCHWHNRERRERPLQNAQKLRTKQPRNFLYN